MEDVAESSSVKRSMTGDGSCGGMPEPRRLLAFRERSVAGSRHGNGTVSARTGERCAARAWRQVPGVLKGCDHVETPDAESRPTHARRAIADRRSKRSPPRDTSRPEPLAPAVGPARRGGSRRRGARDAAGVVLRSRAVQVRPRGDRRVPRRDLHGAARLRLVALHPADLAPRLRRARRALHRGARAGAAGDGAERGRGEPEGQARAGGGSLARARTPAHRVGGEADSRDRHGPPRRDGAALALDGPPGGGRRRGGAAVHLRARLPAARHQRAAHPDGERRGGQPVPDRGPAGRRDGGARRRPGDHRPPRRFRGGGRQPADAGQWGLVRSAAADSGPDRGRRVRAGAVRGAAVRSAGAGRLLRGIDRGRVGHLPARRDRAAVRRAHRVGVPLPRVHRTGAADGGGRRRHRRAAGHRGASARRPDHGHDGWSARFRRRRRPAIRSDGGGRRQPDDQLHGRGGGLLPRRPGGAGGPARDRLAAVHDRRADRSAAFRDVHPPGARHHRQRHRGGVHRGARGRRLRLALARPGLFGERRTGRDGEPVRRRRERAQGGLGGTHVLLRGAGARAGRLPLVLRAGDRPQPAAAGRRRQERPLLHPDPPLQPGLPHAGVAGRRGRGHGRRSRRTGALEGAARDHLRHLQPGSRPGAVRRGGVRGERGLPDPRPGAPARAGGDAGAAHEQPRDAGRSRLPDHPGDPAAGRRVDARGRERAAGAGRRRSPSARAARAAASAACRGSLRRGDGHHGRRRRRRGRRQPAGGRGPGGSVRARARQDAQPVRDAGAGRAGTGRRDHRRVDGAAARAGPPAGARGGAAAAACARPAVDAGRRGRAARPRRGG